MDKPIIALAGIKHSALASEETHYYTATLIVDGEKWGVVGNEGHGGPDFFHPVAGKSYADIKALDERIKATYPPVEAFGMTLDQCLEMLCCDLVNEHLRRQDFKRLLRKPTFINDKNQIMQFSLPKGVPLATAVHEISAKRPEIKLLNLLPEAEAFAALSAAA